MYVNVPVFDWARLSLAHLAGLTLEQGGYATINNRFRLVRP